MKEFKGIRNKIVVAEEHFEYEGRDCIITFCNRGYRCGYVSLNENEAKLYPQTVSGKITDGINYFGIDIKCHGGLTFGGRLPYFLSPKMEWYIGFNCNHYLDGVDLEAIKLYNLEPNNNYPIDDKVCTIVSLETCIQECKSIVSQLNEQFKQTV